MGKYTGKVQLTNYKRTPLSLANDFDESFLLVDVIKESNSAQEVCNATNKYDKRGKCWSVEKDSKEETRLVQKGEMGYREYLICEKKKEETVSGLNSEVKKKILETVIWYGQVDDENNVSLAREHGEVLYELLKEVLTL